MKLAFAGAGRMNFIWVGYITALVGESCKSYINEFNL